MLFTPAQLSNGHHLVIIGQHEPIIPQHNRVGDQELVAGLATRLAALTIGDTFDAVYKPHRSIENLIETAGGSAIDVSDGMSWTCRRTIPLRFRGEWQTTDVDVRHPVRHRKDRQLRLMQ